MEIGKVQNLIVSNQQVSLQQPTTQVTQTSPVFEYNPNSFGLLDLNVSTKNSQTENTKISDKNQMNEFSLVAKIKTEPKRIKKMKIRPFCSMSFF